MDKYCRQTIALNRPNIALIGDISDYSAEQVLQYAQGYPHGYQSGAAPLPHADRIIIHMIYQHKITDTGLHSDSIDWHSPCNS